MKSNTQNVIVRIKDPLKDLLKSTVTVYTRDGNCMVFFDESTVTVGYLSTVTGHFISWEHGNCLLYITPTGVEGGNHLFGYPIFGYF